MSSSKSFRLGLIWTVLAALLTRVSSIVMTIWVSNKVDSSEFALIGIYQGTLSFAIVFSSIGLANIASKYVSEYKVACNNRLGGLISIIILASWILGLLVAATIVLCSGWLSVSFFGGRTAQTSIEIAGWSAIPASISAAQVGVLSGLGRFKAITWMASASAAVLIPAVMVLTLLSGIDGALIAFGVSQIVQVLICTAAIRAEKIHCNFLSALKNTRSEFRLFMTFGVPQVVSGLIVAYANWYSMAIVAGGLGLVELSVFNVGNQWRNAILFLPSALGPILLSKFSERKASGEMERTQLAKILYATIGMGGLCFVFLGLLSAEIISWYNINVPGGRLVFVLIVLSAIIVAFSNTMSKYIAASFGSVPVALLDVLWSVLYVISTYYGCVIFGMYGAASAAVIAASVQSIFSWLYIYKCEHKQKESR